MSKHQSILIMRDVQLALQGRLENDGLKFSLSILSNHVFCRNSLHLVGGIKELSAVTKLVLASKSATTTHRNEQ